MAGLEDVIAAGKEFGIFKFYLPFIIMFALFYGVLQKAKIFGEEKTGKNINIILAGAMSLFVMIYTPAITLSEFLATMFGETLVAIVTILSAILVLFVALTAFGVDLKLVGKDEKYKRGVGAVIIIIILVVLAILPPGPALAVLPGFPFGQIPGIPKP